MTEGVTRYIISFLCFGTLNTSEAKYDFAHLRFMWLIMP